ncbi:uncharacterized protein AC631_01259 [Debaryomyces fabryi]|uniref:Uncharacterized protein n=1 Tax=Debaryomyces fabryi TaxID=58627 RepID=A0A0V1Q3L3_9ASCO|nr:uncharacterized protein AC631_01259 [Debaryomyces fabryi]KSA03004.1 hypothetical protein AC631_01259 [Debaryomyces fabryi]CUM47386.1 unnamed protein product [Debaryomyces fabryi]
MESKEHKKEPNKEVPKYRVKGRFNNRNDKNTEIHPQDKLERTILEHDLRGRHKYTEHNNKHALVDEEKLKLRKSRFSNDNKNYKSTKVQYGYVSRGEDNRLQKSHSERLHFFNHIVNSFIRYSNANTASDLSRDFDRFISKSDIPPDDSAGILEEPTIDSILNNLRKLREALLHERANAFTKKVFLFSIRVSVNMGHYQTYIPSITYLLHSNNSLLLEDVEKQEIATILVLHTAHFNEENSKALQLYFKYINPSEIKTMKILKSWINSDYYNWIQYYNSETDNGKAFVMKFGLPRMAHHMINAINKSYFSFKLKDFQDIYLPNGLSYAQLSDKYKTNWKLDNDTIIVRERHIR